MATNYYGAGSDEPVFRIVEIPKKYLPKKVEEANFDPDSMRELAQAKIQTEYDHVMHLKAWVVLWLLDNCSEISSPPEPPLTQEEAEYLLTGSEAPWSISKVVALRAKLKRWAR